MDGMMTSGFGFAFLMVAFFVFLLYGNVAIGIVLLAIGVVFVTAGGRRRAGTKTGVASPN
jgi:membrane protein implicated in regulation of membrane protease activity